MGTIGIKQILGVHGSLNSLLTSLDLMNPAQPFDWLGEGRFWGIVIMNALHLYPIIYLNFAAALANLDPALDEVAENLGCPAWKRFTKVTLPLTMPGIFAGSTIVFIRSFTELGVPLIFDFTRVTSVQIFDGIKDLSGNPIPYASVAVMLMCTTLLYATSKYFFRRSNFVMRGRASIGHVPKTLPAWKAILCTALFLSVVLLAMLPHVGVVLSSIGTDWYQSILPQSFSLSNYEAALGHEITVPSIANSLKYASASTLVDIVLGIAIAYLVVRTACPDARFWTRWPCFPWRYPASSSPLAISRCRVTEDPSTGSCPPRTPPFSSWSPMRSVGSPTWSARRRRDFNRPASRSRKLPRTSGPRLSAPCD